MLITYPLQDIANAAVLVCLHIIHTSGVLGMFVATGELDGRHGGDDEEKIYKSEPGDAAQRCQISVERSLAQEQEP
ncbi:hypothetical protein OH76DRAFT_1400474 [Lentinus brumalis]|uniref:Uncharacterized protein n=1 Tax=Lentinus brumalis TaxID=2498619 RepID=A0A371DI02_9APHY|nr:hypothetical protein OH76DRAFT_1400474 [Polyporus brumalis]